MQRLDEDNIARLAILLFLRTTMLEERQALGFEAKSASKKAGWSETTWGLLEKGSRPVARKQWSVARKILGLNITEVVHRLDAFIKKHPSIWVERKDDKTHTLCKRPATAPRALRSGNVLNADLPPIRPQIFHELSTYFSKSSEVIAAAVTFGYYTAQPVSLPTPPAEEGGSTTIGGTKKKPLSSREEAVQAILDMPKEKFGLMSRIVHKFGQHSPSELARAYEHFSLALRKRR